MCGQAYRIQGPGFIITWLEPTYNTDSSASFSRLENYPNSPQYTSIEPYKLSFFYHSSFPVMSFWPLRSISIDVLEVKATCTHSEHEALFNVKTQWVGRSIAFTQQSIGHVFHFLQQYLIALPPILHFMCLLLMPLDGQAAMISYQFLMPEVRLFSHAVNRKWPS